MMATKFIKLKPSSPSSNKGFTLVELLVTTLISTTILGLSLGLITQQRQQFVSDQVRTQSNQTLRVGMDLVGADIKNTGDYLDTDLDLPTISVIDGSGNNPDQLILQRKLTPFTLTVCEDVSGNKSTIIVADTAGTIDGCSTISDGNGDNFNNPLTATRRERCEQDLTPGCSRNAPPAANTCDNECVWAYIYDPIDQEGEFFQYSFEQANSTQNWINVGGAATFTKTFEVANKPIIYLLEERHYSLNNNILMLSTNDQAAVPLVNQVANFQVGVNGLPGAFNDTDSGDSPPTYIRSNNWQDINFIQVDITSVDPSESELTAVRNAAQLQLSSQFYPRNALSRQL